MFSPRYHARPPYLRWNPIFISFFWLESQIPDGLETLKHTKSLNLIALSRRAVEFSLRVLDLDPFIDQLETSRYGMDEACSWNIFQEKL